MNANEIFATAMYQIVCFNNKLEINSSLLKDSNKNFEFKEIIDKVCATNENCWILLIDGSVWNYKFINKELHQLTTNETITAISCSHQLLFGVTKSNHLYELSPALKKIHEYPKHQKIRKIVSGLEHCVILTSNGDLFSYGCGLRGALGHGDVNSHEVPLQIEALAGLKIIDVAAGSFHTIAISSFGDVYAWGWNTNGQLGLPKVAQNTFKIAFESHQQVYTSPQLIELEDDDEAIIAVECGSKHTILKTERNRLFVSGLNNHGQLGLTSHVEDIGKFTEIPVRDVNENTKIVCGYWSTYLIDTIQNS
jgi:Regulator of chromosome condensation (RCC1) repeat